MLLNVALRLGPTAGQPRGGLLGPQAGNNKGGVDGRWLFVQAVCDDHVLCCNKLSISSITQGVVSDGL